MFTNSKIDFKADTWYMNPLCFISLFMSSVKRQKVFKTLISYPGIKRDIPGKTLDSRILCISTQNIKKLIYTLQFPFNKGAA